MVTVRLQTLIHASQAMVFDAARDMDIHQLSTEGSGERIVAGRRSGLAELGEEITFEARHFGIRQRLSSKIVEMDPPNRFTDQMVKGAFKSIRHAHLFETRDGVTAMTDVFEFAAPFGLLGRIAERIFLRTYMTRFLTKRNAWLKAYCEEKAREDADTFPALAT